MPNYKLTDDLTIRNVNDELFVFDRKTGFVHTFNGTGKFLWEQVASNKPLPEIIKTLLNEYDVSDEIAKIDAFDFILELQTKQLLQIQD